MYINFDVVYHNMKDEVIIYIKSFEFTSSFQIA